MKSDKLFAHFSSYDEHDESELRPTVFHILWESEHRNILLGGYMRRLHNSSIILTCLVSLFLYTGCAMNLADSSRSGRVHDINIEQDVTPDEMTALIGDEIRWVNHRTGSVHVVFLDGDLEHVSCQRGFRSLGMLQESTKVTSGNAASLCFAKAGIYKYNVRMEANVPSGEIIYKGTIRINDPAKF